MVVYFCVVRHTRTRQGWTVGARFVCSGDIGVALVGLAGTNWFTTKITGLNTLTGRLPVRLVGLPGAESGIPSQ